MAPTNKFSYSNFTDELRTRLSVLDVVGRVVPLTKKGQNYWGCCPFHNEKTPSFSVNEEKGFYHCFGCGEHGDIISFTTDQKQAPSSRHTTSSTLFLFLLKNTTPHKKAHASSCQLL